MTTRRDFIGGVACAALGGCLTKPSTVGDIYPGWSPGELDIHCIHTGCGEQTFFMFPDGTTLLLDCGDMYWTEHLLDVPLQPSMNRLGGEWVSRYVQRLLPTRTIDYFVLSHWHGDHCGAPSRRSTRSADGRPLCGVTRFAEDFDIRHYFDHQYPRSRVYAFNPTEDAVDMMNTWIPFMHRRCGMQAHAFEVGAVNQIMMLGTEASRYRDAFSIRNLHANCLYWDGHGKVADYAPEFKRRMPQMNGQIYENSLSLGFRLDYGRFSAYFGGDIDFPDYEERLAPVIGAVTVAKMNHHGCPSSMGAVHCAALRAKLWTASTWSPYQIDERNLVHMTSRKLYPGKRVVCTGHLPEMRRRDYAGRDFMRDFLPVQGHTVVKVAPGGNSWEFFVLTAADESMRILHHGTGRELESQS